MNVVWLSFITGLTSGGVSCLAVQGGLLASAAGQTEAGNKASATTVGTFLISKLLSHFLLGLALGGIGSVFVFSPKTLGIIQIFAGIFMLVTAARLLNIHPIFRYFVIQPPRWTYRFLRGTARRESIFAPALLGFFSILMPCGVTQAMMLTAISTGNPLMGGLVLAAFVAGTSPLFFILGSVVVKMLEKKVFAYAAAVIVAAFGVMSVSGGLAVRGSIWTLQNFYSAAFQKQTTSGGQIAVVKDGVQEVTVTVTNHGYTSDVTSLKAGIPVRMTVVTKDVFSCARAFTIPEFNISKILPESGTTVIEFTPKKPGRLAYSCSMGMYTGEFNVQ